MGCGWYKDEHGNVIHINHGRSPGRKLKCKFCGREYRGGKLCDFPMEHGKTCDAQMCDRCATTVGLYDSPMEGSKLKRINDTFDLCPIHKDRKEEMRAFVKAQRQI